MAIETTVHSTVSSQANLPELVDLDGSNYSSTGSHLELRTLSRWVSQQPIGAFDASSPVTCGFALANGRAAVHSGLGLLR